MPQIEEVKHFFQRRLDQATIFPLLLPTRPGYNIETTGTLDIQGHLHLDQPQSQPRRVRIIMLVSKLADDLDETT